MAATGRIMPGDDYTECWEADALAPTDAGSIHSTWMDMSATIYEFVCISGE